MNRISTPALRGALYNLSDWLAAERSRLNLAPCSFGTRNICACEGRRADVLDELEARGMDGSTP